MEENLKIDTREYTCPLCSSKGKPKEVKNPSWQIRYNIVNYYNMPRRRQREYSTFDPKIHFKSKGGTGYQMKKQSKKSKEIRVPGKPTKDGLEIAKVFRWEINGRNYSK